MLESMPPNPPSKRLASPPPKKKSWPSLGKACIRPWTTTEKFIWGKALVESTLANS